VCDSGQLCINGNCRDYEPATPCNTCPCTAVCQELFGDGTGCCPGLAGSTQPICVNNTTACP
jgi:hypothetical protein